MDHRVEDADVDGRAGAAIATAHAATAEAGTGRAANPPADPPRTILDLLDLAFGRYADRPAVGLWHEQGTRTTWTYRELDRRSRFAAWRLRHQLDLQPGDRVLTWSPSGPELPAVYLGAMRAGLILVPLDLRMSADAIHGIVNRAEPKRLLIGTGQDAPDRSGVGLAVFPTTTIETLTAEPDRSNDPTEEAIEREVASWPRPEPGDVWDLIFTSGTTGTPKGVMIAHDNLLATMAAINGVIPPLEHRIVSVLPLSHLFEQAIGLIYALSVGADILYVRSRNPRVLFAALQAHRVTSMIVVPQILDLFWSAIEREADRSGRRTLFDRLRRIARRLPYPARRLIFRSVHGRLGGSLRLFVSSGAFLPPALQQAWEDLGVVVIQGYGSTENGFGACTSREDHGLGTVGRPMPPVRLRIADDGEVLFAGPTLFKGYWHDPEATARAIDADGWYHTGDIGHLDPDGRLILSGRTKDRIVLPNGFKVYPEDIENALRVAGIRDAIALETEAGRIETVVLLRGAGVDTADAAKPIVDAAVRAANSQLGPQQRIAGWRLWPEDDFPRTHTLKIRRDPVRAWARREEPAADSASAGR
ncbi:MAG TPA: AMP-binding protein [Candidatus Limnocylindrales bacterium]|nr:AMP-binding protein [Candidatus Limnocylindrales bacterium]